MQIERHIDKEYFGKEYEGKYIFHSISWAKSNEITSNCTATNPLTRQTIVNLKKLQALTLDAVMIERPKAITLDVLMSEDADKGLPLALGELLMSMADIVNGYSQSERDQIKKLKGKWGLEG